MHGQVLKLLSTPPIPAPMPPVPAPMEVVFRTVIAPTNAFLLRLELLARSIRQRGGRWARAPIEVMVSRECEPFDLHERAPWAALLGVSFQWCDDATWSRHGMYGSALARMTQPTAARFVVLLDVDTLLLAPIDDLAASVGSTFGGVIAHVSPACAASPWGDGESHDGEAFWHELYGQLGLETPQLAYQHTGFGIIDDAPARKMAPPYFNLGMLAAPTHVMHEVGNAALDELEQIDRVLTSPFRCQLAVTTALARTSTRSTSLPIKYNFPNSGLFAAAHPDDASDLRVMHYMLQNDVVRDRDIASRASLASLMRRRDLSPANELLRTTIAQVLAPDAALLAA